MKFTDLHDKMAQVKNGLISKEDFIKWLDENVVVKPYIGIAEKYAIITTFVSDYNIEINNNNKYMEDIKYIFIMYEINQLFSLLFKYIDVYVLAKDRLCENYDLVFESGLYDYLIDKCGKDYKDLVFRCDRVSGIANINIVETLTTTFTKAPSVEDIEKVQNIFNSMDTDKLEIIKAIQEYNNPYIVEIINKAKQTAINETFKNVGGEIAN